MLSQRNSTFYFCFVDYKKAFDTVPRDKLLRKLHDKEKTGKVYNIIKDMYESNRSPPMIDDQTDLSCIIWADDLVLLSQAAC